MALSERMSKTGSRFLADDEGRAISSWSSFNFYTLSTFTRFSFAYLSRCFLQSVDHDTFRACVKSYFFGVKNLNQTRLLLNNVNNALNRSNFWFQSTCEYHKECGLYTNLKKNIYFLTRLNVHQER